MCGDQLQHPESETLGVVNVRALIPDGVYYSIKKLFTCFQSFRSVPRKLAEASKLPECGCRRANATGAVTAFAGICTRDAASLTHLLTD